MIYQTGTITTTAGQTKIKGTGTRWKDNLAGISEGCPISYLINNVVYMNTVLSVNSDTEINLTYQVPVAASAAKYQIATFVLDSMSDGVRKIAANQLYIEYFLRNMDTWLTQDGIVEIKTPTGETVRLESIIALKKLIDGKYDKKGGQIDGPITATSTVSANKKLEVYNNELESYALLSVEEPIPKIRAKQKGTAWAEHYFQNKSGTLMHIGDFGIGSYGLNSANNNFSSFIGTGDTNIASQVGFPGNGAGFQSVYAENRRSQVYVNAAGALFYRFSLYSGADKTTPWKEAMPRGDYGIGVMPGNVVKGAELAKTSYAQFFRQGGGSSDDTNTFNSWGAGITSPYDSTRHYGLFFEGVGARVQHYSSIAGIIKTNTFYTTANTTKDANGNLKAASPIIKVFADHIELNDESEGIELEKLGTGHYKLKGTLGMNSDASWGGIHGGLVVPNGINNLPLVWADFDVLPDGDIIIETRYRKHTLHPRLEAQRLMTYPEFLDENNVEREDYDYCDIPNGHWIDVRVNMPSDSIYNQKLAEAQRLAKLEAERLAEEEAKRAAEEAERAEQEATERKQYDLGDNDTLL